MLLCLLAGAWEGPGEGSSWSPLWFLPLLGEGSWSQSAVNLARWALKLGMKSLWWIQTSSLRKAKGGYGSPCLGGGVVYLPLG